MKQTVRRPLLVYLAFAVLALVGFAARLNKLNTPLADWHSWRQADTAAVARNYRSLGIDVLHPRYDDLSNIQSGKDNPQGWRMVEFPLYQAVGAWVDSVVPVGSLEAKLRVLTALASVATAVLVGSMVVSFASVVAGFSATAAYLFLPYSIYYGRVILPDPHAVFLAVASIYCLLGYVTYWQTKRFGWLIAITSAVFAALALLVKPVAAFLLLPSAYLVLRNMKWTPRYIGLFAVYAVIALVPFVWWRGWIAQFPEGIPVYDWLFNKGDIRFKGAWFQWLFAERIAKLILGYWGLVPFGLGLAVLPSKKEGWFFRWLAVGSLLYLAVIAGGNVQHDYYQIFLLPVIAAYAGIGTAFLMSGSAGMSRFGGAALVVVCWLFAAMFGWYQVRGYYWINRPEIVEAGVAADAIIPKNAKVIASYNGDTTFLYQIRRQGWPLGFDIDDKIKKGATHYVTVSPTDNDLETKDLAERFTVLVRNDRYAIIDLTRKRQ